MPHLSGRSRHAASMTAAQYFGIEDVSSTPLADLYASDEQYCGRSELTLCQSTRPRPAANGNLTRPARTGHSVLAIGDGPRHSIWGSCEPAGRPDRRVKRRRGRPGRRARRADSRPGPSRAESGHLPPSSVRAPTSPIRLPSRPRSSRASLGACAARQHAARSLASKLSLRR